MYKLVFSFGIYSLVSFQVACSSSSSSSSSDPGWTEEEYQMFTTQGVNSIGVDPLTYDYAFVVNENSSSLKLELSDDAPDGVSELSTSELQKCSDHFGEQVLGVSIHGDSYHSDFSDADIIAVKMNGNQSSISILITNPEEEEEEESSEEETTTAEGEDEYDVKGICIISSGNKPTANVIINASSVEKIYYMASGNSAAANFEIKEGSTVSSFGADLTGNAGALVITGDGEYQCDNITVSGNATTPSCGSSESAVEAKSAFYYYP